MTMMSFETVRCAVCGEENSYYTITSTHEFGSPDLDLRPPPNRRNLLPYMIQHCNFCGYTWRNISEPCSCKQILGSFRYRHCDFIPFHSRLSRDYYRGYLIALKEQKEIREILFYILGATWHSDDLGRTEARAAAICRRKAARLIASRAKTDDTLYLMRADLLRRCGLFSRLLREYVRAEPGDPKYKAILEYQITCARMRDPGRHTVEEALKKQTTP